MMEYRKFSLKLYAADSEQLQPAKAVPVFHDFISQGTLGELMIDVVDYQHVHQGPGVVLIGHATDYAFDLGEGRPGLCCSRKREHVAREERPRDLLRRTLHAAAALEARPELGVRFRTDELLFTVLDGLAQDDDSNVLAQTAHAWSGLLAQVLGTEPSVSREGEPGQPTRLRMRLAQAASVGEALRSA
ncbi:MAG: hypothetical protein R3B13_02970 [Polyangiaceae bacterium]